MLEVGSVRKQYTKNILFKNLLDGCVAGLGWWATGFGMAFLFFFFFKNGMK